LRIALKSASFSSITGSLCAASSRIDFAKKTAAATIDADKTCTTALIKATTDQATLPK